MLHELEQQLADKDLTLAEFSELCVRLLDYSVLSREDSQVEQQLYDRFVRCENLVADYLSVLHIRFLHDRQFQFVRVYPPGAEVPGLDSQPDVAIGAPLRQRLSQQEVAVVLVLRTLYDQGVREARVDEQGAVSTTVEDVGISLRNLLGRSLPENLTERRALWRRLRQWRLVRFADSEGTDGKGEDSAADRLLQIRPSIVSLVSDHVLQQLEQPDSPPAATATDPDTDTDTDASTDTSSDTQAATETH
ncbi:DUF4194 domain-containing protein [Natronospirillum operosum]|uniref:DUF4194 domain-containing protein n=1 Tax=Natronospirillum operosum TaxID=2759953 RepID=A0A4Z0WH62_9GAMM|nr:DUF4194 domain-containing protein [Natronospirillum operosum]TGG95287.1 DUF4194 domain-containing protein [Natronospirillum operosum]